MASAKQVLVWRGKGGVEYYDASTPEEWAQACLDVARELDEFAAYEEWEIEEEVEIDIEGLPEAYRAGARATAAAIVRRNADARANNEGVAAIKRALAENSLELVVLGEGTPQMSVEPALWKALRARSHYEYEDVSLQRMGAN